MDKKTLKALKGSIKKWEKIVAGTGTDKGMDNCPLCHVNDHNCKKCPVYLITNHTNCSYSPYIAWCNHMEKSTQDWDSPWKAIGPKQKALAQAELNFLIALLPTRERK